VFAIAPRCLLLLVAAGAGWLAGWLMNRLHLVHFRLETSVLRVCCLLHIRRQRLEALFTLLQTRVCSSPCSSVLLVVAVLLALLHYRPR